MIYLVPVHSLQDAYIAAFMRNECRQFMTRDQRELDVTRQRKFYHRLAWSPFELFVAYSDKEPIGFAVLKTVGQRTWLTAGLAKPFRGKGHGKTIFSQLIRKCNGTVPWLTVLKSNKLAYRLYRNLGFKIVRTTRRIHLMKLQ